MSHDSSIFSVSICVSGASLRDARDGASIEAYTLRELGMQLGAAVSGNRLYSEVAANPRNDTKTFTLRCAVLPVDRYRELLAIEAKLLAIEAKALAAACAAFAYHRTSPHTAEEI